MERSNTQKLIDKYAAYYWENCAPEGYRCESCDKAIRVGCLCPVTPEATTYSGLTDVYRFYQSDPNIPGGFIDKSTRGWYRYAKDVDGIKRFIKFDGKSSEFQWLEYDPDYTNKLSRENRGPGWYRLNEEYKAKQKWRKKQGRVKKVEVEDEKP